MLDRNVRMFNPTHRYGTVPDTSPSDYPTVAWAREYVDPPTEIATDEAGIYFSVGSSVISIDHAGEERWQRTIPNKGGGQSGPTVVDGTVYIGDRGQGVYALDAESGATKWRFETTDEAYSVPAVVDDTVVVASPEGNVYAINAANGRNQWFREVGGQFSMPIVVDSTVFISSGSSDHGVYALDLESGRQQWYSRIHNPSPPAVVDETVYVGSNDDTVFALEATTGQEAWKFDYGGAETGYGNTSAPTVFNDTVFVGAVDHNLYALDATTGNEQWRFQTHGSVTSPAVVDGTVLVGSRDTNIYALDAGTGTQQWKFETDGVGDTLTPTVMNNTVYVANLGSGSSRVADSKNNYIYALQGRADTTAEASERCSVCEASLSEYDNPPYCPECGTKTNAQKHSNTKVYEP